MFDYLFFRIYQFYEKHEKGWDSTWRASLYISAIEFLIVYSIFMFFDIFLGKSLSNSFFVQSHPWFVKAVSISLMFVLYFINQKRYRRRKEKILNKYKKKKTTNHNVMFMVFLTFLTLLLFFSPVLWNELYKIIK